MRLSWIELVITVFRTPGQHSYCFGEVTDATAILCREVAAHIVARHS